MPDPTPGLHLRLDQIPKLTDRVPIYSTRPIVEEPMDFVREQTRRLAPHADVRTLGRDGTTATYDGDRLIAYANPTSGQSHIVPLIDGLEGHRSLRAPATAGAKRLLAQQAQLFGDGRDQITLSDPIQLMASTFTQRGTRTHPSAVLATVKLQRTVAGLPVFGPGSTASASFSHHGLEGFNHRWTAAALTTDHVQAHPVKRVREQLVEHIGGLADMYHVQLHDAATAYYDDGLGHLQPVYRYRITIPSPDGRTAPAMYVGYLPIGEAIAQLPALHPVVDVTPTDAAVGHITQDTSVKIGRYVVRNDDSGWVASANAFWNSLSTGLPFLPHIDVQNAQYYWAHPELFTTQKDSYINSVHLALTEVHGGWGTFSTLQNNADFVNLTDIPAPGYGGDTSPGHLAYWILHSCEVIPTSTDEKSSYDAWWNIFNGLHAAMGYRTEMYINDQVTGAFGTLVGLGAPIVSSWLSMVINDNNYQHGESYADTYRGITEPMGRPSAVTVTGHGDDTLRMTAPLPRPSSLTEYWYNN